MSNSAKTLNSLLSLLLGLCVSSAATADTISFEPSQKTTTLTISGQGSSVSAAEAISASEGKLSEVEAKAKQIAKGGFSRLNHNISISSNGYAAGFPVSTNSQEWTYNFSATYNLNKWEDGAPLADQLVKSGLAVTLNSDVQGQ